MFVTLDWKDACNVNPSLHVIGQVPSEKQLPPVQPTQFAIEQNSGDTEGVCDGVFDGVAVFVPVPIGVPVAVADPVDVPDKVADAV